MLPSFIHHRKHNYDHSEKIKGAVKGNVVEWAKEPTVLPALLAESAPRVGVMGVTATQLPELTVLWFVVRLMRAKQNLFPRTNLAADPIVLDPYDVLHGWKLLAFAWKQIQGGKLAKSKQQVSPALPPVYHRPDDTNLGSGQDGPNPSGPDMDAEDLFGGQPSPSQSVPGDQAKGFSWTGHCAGTRRGPHRCSG